MTTAIRARQALWIHVSVVLTAGILAYAGVLNWRMLSLPYADKLCHFVLVGGIAFWIARGWWDPRWRMWRLSLPVALVIPLVLATLEEGLQHLSPVRRADPMDWLADVAGLFCFWFLAKRRCDELAKSPKQSEKDKTCEAPGCSP